MPSPIPNRDRHQLGGNLRNLHQPSPQAAHLQQQVASAMLAVLPPTQPPALRKPKLHLQTSFPSRPVVEATASTANIPSDKDSSPTSRNTRANAFSVAPTPVVVPTGHPPLAVIPMDSNSRAGNRKRGPASPFAQDTVYTPPIGLHSILRKTTLPARYFSTSSSRKHRRLFPPTKRVAFSENLKEVAPTPTIEVSEEDAEERSCTPDERQQRIAKIQGEDGHLTVGPRHGKRRREWVWPTPEGW